MSASQSREVGNGNCGKEGVLVQVILGNAPEKLRKLRGLTQWKTVSCWCAVTSAESGRMPPCAALQEPSCLRPCPPQRCLPRPPTATSSWQTVRKRRWDCTQEGETAPVLLPMFQATVVTRPTVIERGSRIHSVAGCLGGRGWGSRNNYFLCHKRVGQLILLAFFFFSLFFSLGTELFPCLIWVLFFPG